MAKEPLKIQIERLEQAQQANLEQIAQLNAEIAAIQAAADKAFAGSPWRAQLEDEIEFQKQKYNVYEKRLNREIEKNEALLDKIEQLKAQIANLTAEKEKTGMRAHNERNAGRKVKIDEKTIAYAQMYRAQGKTIKEIAKLIGFSYGSTQKIIKTHCNKAIGSSWDDVRKEIFSDQENSQSDLHVNE